MARIRARIKKWDRFAQWAPGAAILTLLLTVAALVLAATTQRTDPVPTTSPGAAPAAAIAPMQDIRDADLDLFERIAQRVDAGEGYYPVAIEERRAHDLPVRPGLTVRLPTLAYLSAWADYGGMIFLALLLALAVLAAWWVRLRDEPGGPEHARLMLLLLIIGAAIGFRPQYLAVHEVWAGLLLALSFGLHRDDRWLGAWLAAALALAIRETAVLYVLLMGAMALVSGNRREAVAWVGLVILFAIGLGLHLSALSAIVTEADRSAPGWLTWRGPGGWTSDIVRSSPLHLLPGWLAAPLAILPLLGWAGWRSTAGRTGFLLSLGYGIVFMLAGRGPTFYWALIVIPVWFVGLAFVPRALRSLWNSARGI